MPNRPPLPPFTRETAVEKVRLAEDAWNSRDPARVALAYTEDSRWRNRSEFFAGRAAIVEFLTRKWANELDYRLIKELWAFHENRISVRFQYEWRDDIRPLVSRARQRAMGIRWRWTDASPGSKHQRCGDRVGRPQIPVARRTASRRPSRLDRPRSMSPCFRSGRRRLARHWNRQNRAGPCPLDRKCYADRS